MKSGILLFVHLDMSRRVNKKPLPEGTIPIPASVIQTPFTLAQLSSLPSGGLGLTPLSPNVTPKIITTTNIKPMDLQNHGGLLLSPLQTNVISNSPFASSPTSHTSQPTFQDISEPPSDNDSDNADSPSDKSKSFRERRREAHTQSEQKRRDAIKKGYQELEIQLPNLRDDGGQKPSKAVILQKSIDYLVYLEEQKKKQADEIDALKRDLMGLQIMKQTYDKMAANFKNQPDEGETPVPDEVKFKVYQDVMDRVFQSFDNRVVANSFAELSGSAFNWLEESCTPHTLHHITKTVLNSNFPPNGPHLKSKTGGSHSSE